MFLINIPLQKLVVHFLVPSNQVGLKANGDISQIILQKGIMAQMVRNSVLACKYRKYVGSSPAAVGVLERQKDLLPRRGHVRQTPIDNNKTILMLCCHNNNVIFVRSSGFLILCCNRIKATSKFRLKSHCFKSNV